ncbi:TolC family protein [Cytophaga aurantiaca]|uniref:TolC family protein n=1 Tax=Cytophaga aurantiaca TaxID=29530 RepID=UPI00039DD536|nr:TolC family protein [Cytophaga aurantiaca]
MKQLSILLLLSLMYTAVQAQQDTTTSEPTSFSLQQAIEYGLNENFNVKNANLQSDLSTAQKGEVRANLLPQVSANADLIHSFNVQQNITESGVGFQANSPLPKGTPIAFQLGLRNTFTPNVSASQVLFDQAFFSAQGAAKANEEIAEKTITQTRIDVSVNITKAYYGVLVNEQQLKAIESNLTSLDSSYQETIARYESGFARNIDVSRILVSLNNVREQKEETTRLVALSRSILRYQMNLSENNPLILTDSLYPAMMDDIQKILTEKKSAVYTNRIEYSIMQSQEKYNNYLLKNAKAGHYPRLVAISTFGYNPGATYFADLSQSARWHNYSTIGLRLQVPIFSGLAVNYRVQQRQIQSKITENKKHSLEKEIDLEVEQALINLYNSVQSFNIQRENLNLAQQNLEILRAEYKAGIALNVEVTTAESDLITAQTNFFRAVYVALISKANYDRAVGNIVR